MRILFASPNLPVSPFSGGAQRTRLLINALREIAEVDFVFLPSHLPKDVSLAEIHRDYKIIGLETTEKIAEYTRFYQCFNFFGTGLSSFYLAGRHRWRRYDENIRITGDIQQYDLVVSRYLSSACILNLFRHPRLIIDVDDYDPDRLRQRILTAGWFKRLTITRCLRFSELAHKSMLPKAAHCWVSNPSDRTHTGLSNATLLPNIPYFPNGLPRPLPPPPKSQPPVFLIVGTLNYSANADGIDAFLREAWTSLRNQAPNVELHIVGQGMSEKQRNRWASFPGVKPIGFVEFLAESYQRCIATLAPILAGGGTNIKVLESGAYGRPCVVSRVAHRGFEKTLPDGEACLVANTMLEMSFHCFKLLRENGLSLQIGLRARASIEINYTQAVFQAAVMAGIQKVVNT